MGIDSSIYSNFQAPKIDLPSPLDSAQKAMTLSTLGMQQQQMQRQYQQQDAVRQAYAKNTGPDGKLDQQGFLSQLGQAAPQAAMEYQGQFSKMNEEQAKAQAAQVDAAQKTLSVTMPAMDYLAGLPADQRAVAFPKVMKQVADQGIPMHNVPPQYDDGWFRQAYMTGSQMKDHLDNMKTAAETQKTQAEAGKIPGEIEKNKAETLKAYSDIGQAPAKLNAELYGSRSPNAELTSQYGEQAKPIRQSQGAMAQMLDNYRNPSPQGDASLVLNAFKIKFPTAPDVNSLKELGESQATVDQWKNLFHKSTAGGFDQATRDNLMRDGISTFRGNVGTLNDIQDKYKARAKFQGVNDPTITYEPAVDKTYAEAMDLQKKIGPYVPPAERGGVMGTLGKLASKLTGGSEPTANAATPKLKPGVVEDGHVYLGGDPGNPKSWKRVK